MENNNIESTESTNESTNESTEIETTSTPELSTDAIQAALAKTRSNKTAAEAGGNEEASAPRTPRVKLTDEEKAAKEQERKIKQEARTAERKAASAAKKAERDAEKGNKIAHMAKVNKAAENLPELSVQASTTVDEIMNDLSASEITGVIAHLVHRQRAAATATAMSATLEVGQTVRINSAEGASARYVGQLAEVLTVQRIRCYVRPLSAPASKRVYLFNSDVRQVEADELESVQSSPSSEGEPEVLSA